HPYTYEVQPGNDLNAIGSALAGKIASPFGVELLATDTLRITRTGDVAFTVDYNVAQADVEGTWSVSGTPAKYSTAAIVLGGTVTPDETWTITLNGTPYSTTPTTASLDAVGSGLDLEIDIDFDAVYVPLTKTLTITHAAGVSVGLDITPAPIDGTISAGGTKAYTDATWTLSGAAASESWSITLNGVTYSTSSSGTDIDVLGAALAGEIPNTYTATYDSDNDRLNVTRVDGTAFSAGITPGASGTAALYSSIDSDTHWVTAEFTMGGTVHPDQTWRIVLGGVTYSFSPTTRALNGVGNGLVGDISASFNPSYDPNSKVLSVSRALPFTISYGFDPAAVQGTGSVNQVASTISHYAVANVLLGGHVTPHETWTITLNGTPYVFSPATVSLGDLGAGLDAAIGTAFDAEYHSASGTLTITYAQGVAVNMVITPADVESAAVIGGTPDAEWTNTITLKGASAAGDTWTVTLNGSEDLSAVPASNGLPAAASALAQALRDAGYDASADGSVVILTTASGDVIAVNRVEELRRRGDLISGETDGRKHYTSAVITLQGNVGPGDVWTVTLNGETFTYITAPDKNLNGVAEQLYLKINAETEYDVVWNGSTLTITPGSAAWFTGTTVQTDRGGGSAKGVFDIDHATVIEGKSTRSYWVKRVETYYIWLPFVGNIPLFTWTFWEQRFQSYYYTQSAYLELYDSNNQLMASSNASALDAGSRTTLDPFIEKVLKTAGTYTIKVKSYRDYHVNNPYFHDGVYGVATGMSYQLNVSLQR
ncbi:MAG: hypothetical protein V3R81_08255, partial [Gammaproteobacteria bacterium]